MGRQAFQARPRVAISSALADPFQYLNVGPSSTYVSWSELPFLCLPCLPFLFLPCSCSCLYSEPLNADVEDICIAYVYMRNAGISLTRDDARYRLYQEHGRLINLYDWFQGFCSIFAGKERSSKRRKVRAPARTTLPHQTDKQLL